LYQAMVVKEAMTMELTKGSWTSEPTPESSAATMSVVAQMSLQAI
jgi:hypothetical protein